MLSLNGKSLPCHNEKLTGKIDTTKARHCRSILASPCCLLKDWYLSLLSLVKRGDWLILARTGVVLKTQLCLAETFAWAELKGLKEDGKRNNALPMRLRVR